MEAIVRVRARNRALRPWFGLALGCVLLAIRAESGLSAGDPPHPVMTWVKHHPREGAEGKPPPRMGYETSYGYDGVRGLLVRYGGHNQGGGGEQNSEVWTYDLQADVWTLKEPNDAPPGVCCAQQNVFDDSAGLFVRFPAFSGSHGWQSRREIYLKDSSVWTYDLGSNVWRDMRPLPQPPLRPLRGAAYDPHHQVVAIHGGEGASHGTVVYDPYANTWHWMEPDPAPPASVSQPGFAYDPVNRVFVLFGSQFASDPRTWLYDLRRNEWRVLDVPERPPADKSCPVMAADSLSGIVLASLIGPEGHETWALDVAKAQWRRLRPPREPDPSGARNRVLLYLPDRNLFVLENRTTEEQQIWTFRYAATPAPRPAPQDLRVTTDANGATLSWTAPPGGGDLHYNAYRADGGVPWRTEFGRIAEGLADTVYRDAGIGRAELHYYEVRAVDGGGDEGPPSLVKRTQPPVVTDLCVSVLDPGQVELQWSEASADDVVGYHVERAEVSVYSTDQAVRVKQRYRQTSDLAAGRVEKVGAFGRLTTEPLRATTFTDETVDLSAGQHEPAGPLVADSPLPPDQLDPLGQPYRFAVYGYRITALNALGVESGPSPCRFTYPSAVRDVFVREVGDDGAELKWSPNPERAIEGYLVYRQDGRWDIDTITRLTPRPIAAMTFTDDGAGPATRRYEVVAVDALGQEGEPSQPVWSRREWWRFYVPYVGEWHQ